MWFFFSLAVLFKYFISRSWPFFGIVSELCLKESGELIKLYWKSGKGFYGIWYRRYRSNLIYHNEQFFFEIWETFYISYKTKSSHILVVSSTWQLGVCQISTSFLKCIILKTYSTLRRNVEYKAIIKKNTIKKPDWKLNKARNVGIYSIGYRLYRVRARFGFYRV